MYKLNLIAVVTIVAVVSLVVGMTAPAPAFAAQHENMTLNMDDNMSSMGNATSMTETENLPSANQTGISEDDPIPEDDVNVVYTKLPRNLQ